MGDLARSPRMLNHARELSRAGHDVTMVGFRERPLDALKGAAIAELPSYRRIGRWGLPGAAVRMSLILVQLTAILLRLRPRAILAQNPPSFPTLIAGTRAPRCSSTRAW